MVAPSYVEAFFFYALRPCLKAYLSSIHPASQPASQPAREFPHAIAISVFWPKMLAKHCRGCCWIKTAPRFDVLCLCRYRLSRHPNHYLAADLAIRGPAAGKHTNTSEPTSHYGVRVATIFVSIVECTGHFVGPQGPNKRAQERHIVIQITLFQ
jgi:hypothetical protein